MATEKISDRALTSGEAEKPVLPGSIDVLKNKNQLDNKVELSSEKNIESKVNQAEKNRLEQAIKNEAELGAGANNQAQIFYQARIKAIDDILSSGLHEVFLQMSPKKQKEFKTVGEETVVKIVALLDQTKVKVDKIINLIRKWLKIIPGVNKFFLEQEAKIKADRIIKLKK